jgi:L-lactate dehydrogenase complex protein LldF
MLLRLRADGVKAGKAQAIEKIAIGGFRAAMTNPALYKAGGKLASLGTRLLSKNGQLRKLPLPLLNMWTRQRDFPAFAPKSFTELWEERERRGGAAG